MVRKAIQHTNTDASSIVRFMSVEVGNGSIGALILSLISILALPVAPALKSGPIIGGRARSLMSRALGVAGAQLQVSAEQGLAGKLVQSTRSELTGRELDEAVAG